MSELVYKHKMKTWAERTDRIPGYVEHTLPAGIYYLRQDEVAYIGIVQTYVHEFGTCWSYSTWVAGEVKPRWIEKSYEWTTPEQAAEVADRRIRELIGHQRARLEEHKREEKMKYEHEENRKWEEGRRQSWSEFWKGFWWGY
jgi:hypothetical protein